MLNHEEMDRTHQADPSPNKYKHRRTKALAANVIAIAAMITVLTTLTSNSEHNVSAQMTGDHGEGWVGNMSSGHEQKIINNGTINLEQIIFQAIGSKINTSLTQAMATAER